MFSQVPVCPQGGLCPLYAGIHPLAGTPPSADTPWVGTPLPGAGKPPPLGQVHPLPWARYTPGQVHTLLGRYTPQAGTTIRVGTPRQVHPVRADTSPLRSACWDTVNKRAVCIPLECILVY